MVITSQGEGKGEVRGSIEFRCDYFVRVVESPEGRKKEKRQILLKKSGKSLETEMVPNLAWAAETILV